MAAYTFIHAVSSLSSLSCVWRKRVWNGISRAVVSSSTSREKKDAVTRGNRATLARRAKRLPIMPRIEKMPVNQEWSSVYPTACSFKPNAVPLPIRMGYPVKNSIPAEKKGNLELIKIPNFLHLTPLAVKKHCSALKAFCTTWPDVLDSDSKFQKHFPIQVESKNFVSSGPSLRNPNARIVTLFVKLKDLNLDHHSEKKLIKLAGERYNPKTDTIAITADRCPLRRQNYDYAMYLLTVLYHESWKHETWEEEKTKVDHDEYIWNSSISQMHIINTLLRMKGLEDSPTTREELMNSVDLQEFRNSVTTLKNTEETESSILQYKESVKKVLGL
ncbi:28S ribosomal protein S35, mitochondrial [Erpetoichthys calabaricus]|uniref:Mitochondrial ribosomal protein S35 n=1 Tax=Erpetoichthys calabaricus TaxID=27687 RepID=A0A8C4X2I5_ERPCA|nr:28S ribosomal protein S35, mitochondrial [Erpetoichthys calabaricus]